MHTTQATPDSTALVEFLSTPSSYPDESGPVQVVETHISWVFLTSRHAYKLKKPVRFEFLDFSTPLLRRRACQDELHLNRRLAPHVYLDVLPISQAPDGLFTLGAGGSTIDWLVQMRRLPAENALDVVLRDGRLPREVASAIAEYLVHFYARLSPEPLAPDGYREALERHVRANGAALLESSIGERLRIGRIQGAQLRYLTIQADLIGNRAAGGRIVEGHGDLRPEHIYVEAPPAVIDCIEFSRELRTVDIADELSFLAMECERLGDGGLGGLVLAAYAESSGDRIAPSLLAFYRAYRACVRAKVVLLRRQQQDDQQSSDSLFYQYIDLADRHAAQLGPPSAVIVGGLMGTGKSTLAEKLAEAFGVAVLSTDRIRRSLLGASQSPAAYGEGHYQPAVQRQVYDEMFRQARERLGERQSLILDGTFLTQELRTRAFDLARQYGAVPLNVQCTCPKSIALARVEARAKAGGSESEARRELYDQQARDFEPLLLEDPAVTVDTTQAMPDQLQAVSTELRRRLFE
jgi:aminoglycoside phosphotransferase family enzyme/predicted kinase